MKEQIKFKPSVWKKMKIVKHADLNSATVRQDSNGTNWRWVSSGLFVVADKVSRLPRNSRDLPVS